MKKINKDISIVALTQIAWGCRRGMLELDVLLGNFFKSQYQSLTDAEKLNFIELLGVEDPLLFAWLFGQESPPHAFLNILEKITQHAKSQF